MLEHQVGVIGTGILDIAARVLVCSAMASSPQGELEQVYGANQNRPEGVKGPFCWCQGDNCVHNCQARKAYGPGNHVWKFCCRKVQTKGSNWWTQEQSLTPICKVCYEASDAARAQASGAPAADATPVRAPYRAPGWGTRLGLSTESTPDRLIRLQKTVSEISDNYVTVEWVNANYVSKREHDAAIANLQNQIELLQSTVKDLNAWVQEVGRPPRV